MTINNKKDFQCNSVKELIFILFYFIYLFIFFFLHVTFFLSPSDVSVVFKSHFHKLMLIYKTNLFLHERFLISKCS